MRCDACTSYEPWDNGVGRCHFMPPSGVRDARNEMWTPFPLVEPAWWCSQHQATQSASNRPLNEEMGQASPYPPPLPMTPPATAFGGAVATPEDDF
jgi:hypothetical protein